MTLDHVFSIAAIHLVSASVFSGRYYIPSNVSMPWTDAQTYCNNEYGTTLATIITSNDFYNFKKMWDSSGTGNPWIGLNDIAEEGQFLWDSDTPCASTSGECSQFWADNAPTGEHCAFYLESSQRLRDFSCERSIPFACDKEMETIDCGTLDDWEWYAGDGNIGIVTSSECEYDGCIKMSGPVSGEMFVARQLELTHKSKVIIHFRKEGVMSSPGWTFEAFCLESTVDDVHLDISNLTDWVLDIDASSYSECASVTVAISGNNIQSRHAIFLREISIEYVIPPINALSSAPTPAPTNHVITSGNHSLQVENQTSLMILGAVILVLLVLGSFVLRRINESKQNDLDQKKEEDDDKKARTQLEMPVGLSQQPSDDVAEEEGDAVRDDDAEGAIPFV